MMLKTDISFSTDPEYRKWVEIYANDMDRLTEDFKASWEKLMNRDMGDRPCLGYLQKIDVSTLFREAIAPKNSWILSTRFRLSKIKKIHHEKDIDIQAFELRLAGRM